MLTFCVQAVRQYAFPDHKLKYTGKVAYRVLIPQSKVAHIRDIPAGSCFWHTADTHVYTNPLDNGLFEIATRAFATEEHGAKVSWGQVVPKEDVVGHYDGYCETIREVIAAPESWLEFAHFAGHRLESVIRNGVIALIGDASHREWGLALHCVETTDGGIMSTALSGAFGKLNAAFSKPTRTQCSLRLWRCVRI